MIELTISALIVALICLVTFELTEGIYKYAIVFLFLKLLSLSALNSMFYLDIPIAGSIVLINFIVILFMLLVSYRILSFIVIGVVASAFVLHVVGQSIPAQNLTHFAYYSIIILVIKLILNSNKQNV